MTFLVIFLLVVIVLGLVYFVSVYNKLIGQIEAVNNDKKQIDVQLDRRYKVFESLIETVKKYMDYEQTTLKDVVKLRSQSVQAVKTGDAKSQIEAEEAISKIASNINLLFERYPDLKANQNALQLQEEIVNSENKLAFAKQAYNDSIETYNATKKSFFEAMVVSMAAAKLDKAFIYWGVSEEKGKELEGYQVKF